MKCPVSQTAVVSTDLRFDTNEAEGGRLFPSVLMILFAFQCSIFYIWAFQYIRNYAFGAPLISQQFISKGLLVVYRKHIWNGKLEREKRYCVCGPGDWTSASSVPGLGLPIDVHLQPWKYCSGNCRQRWWMQGWLARPSAWLMWTAFLNFRHWSGGGERGLACCKVLSSAPWMGLCWTPLEAAVFWRVGSADAGREAVWRRAG